MLRTGPEAAAPAGKDIAMDTVRHTAAFALALALLVPAARAAGVEMPSSVPEPAEMEQAGSLSELPPAESEEPASSDPQEEGASLAEAWNLLLVNPWNALPEDFSVELTALPGGMQVDSRIYGDLSAMLTDCRSAGLRPLICSAYRTQEKQAALYSRKTARLRAAGYSREDALREAGRWVAAPGTSEHQTGMALDIVALSYQLLNERQEETAEQKWLMEHCWEYGFILRYPAEKCDITGIGYEPWHYRYVGREAASVMRERRLCLEEFLQTLQDPPEEDKDPSRPNVLPVSEPEFYAGPEELFDGR